MMDRYVSNQNCINEHMEQQIELIEHTIRALLQGVSLEDLTTSQRLSFAAKMLSPYARILTLQYNMHHGQQREHEEATFLGELYQQLRLSLVEGAVDAPLAHEQTTE
jgi:hypothetical protein